MDYAIQGVRKTAICHSEHSEESLYSHFLRSFTSFHFVQDDKCAVFLKDDSLRVFVILSIAKDLFIRGIEILHFISFRSG